MKTLNTQYKNINKIIVNDLQYKVFITDAHQENRDVRVHQRPSGAFRCLQGPLRSCDAVFQKTDWSAAGDAICFPPFGRIGYHCEAG